MLLTVRRIQHCRVCGSPAEYRVPADDNRERATCTRCGEIHYENPLNVVGTVPVFGERVLLCRRAIEPRHGFWTLYRARMLSELLAPGPETLEARLFREDEVPWDELAFRTVRRTLELYFDDRRQGRFGIHVADIG
jgi:hypothetical protein